MNETPGAQARIYLCVNCSYLYDQAIGDPDRGIPPGTPFEALPSDWECPQCGVSKESFKPLSDFE